MYKELLRLWWTQKRRNFTWKDVFVSLYGYFVLACMIGGMYFGSDGEVAEVLDMDLSSYALATVTTMLAGDLMEKMAMKKEATVMDDYLRTRPVSAKAWDAFVLTVNLLDYWTWAYVLLVGVVALLLFPWTFALALALTTLTASMVNAMALSCYRRADQWWLRLPMIVVLALFIVGSMAYGFVAAAIFTPSWQMGIYASLNVIAIASLCIFMTHMRCYDERQTKTQRVRSLNVASRFSLDWAAVWRPKRIRQMVFFLALFMIADFYLVAWAGEVDDRFQRYMIMVFTICMPSVVLAQWTFGVEANFFHGLWTKPVSIFRLLLNKYYFFILLNTLAAVALLPTTLLGWQSVWSILACYFFTVGVTNLACMPTCLFSQRLDLFSSAFFNYQGASTKINFYGLVCFLPIGIAIMLYDLMAETTANLVLFGLGIAGILIHRIALRPLADAYVKRRHARFEEYMK